MHPGRLRYWLSSSFALLLLACTTLTAPAQSPPEPPQAVLAKIYALYADNGTGLTSNAKLVRDYCSEALARRLNSSKQAIDFDPFVNGQDWSVSDLRITPAGTRGEAALIDVTFKNLATPVKLSYEMIRQNGSWRVNDIVSNNKNATWTLSKLLDKRKQ